MALSRPLLIVTIGRDSREIGDVVEKIMPMPWRSVGLDIFLLYAKIGVSRVFGVDPFIVDNKADGNYDSFVFKSMEKELLNKLSTSPLIEDRDCVFLYGNLVLRNLKLLQKRFEVKIVSADLSLDVKPYEDTFRCHINRLPGATDLGDSLKAFMETEVHNHVARVGNLPIDLTDPIFRLPLFQGAISTAAAPPVQATLRSAAVEDAGAIIDKLGPYKRSRAALDSDEGSCDEAGNARPPKRMKALTNEPLGASSSKVVKALTNGPLTSEMVREFLDEKLEVNETSSLVFSAVKQMIVKEFGAKSSVAEAMLHELDYKSFPTSFEGKSINAIANGGNVRFDLRKVRMLV